MELGEWQAVERRIDAAQVPDGRALLDRLPRSFVEGLTPREALALKFAPSAYLRPKQMAPTDLDWLTWVLVCGRGWGKSLAAAAWMVGEILKCAPARPADFLLCAPSLQLCETLQLDPIRTLLPPWVKVVPRLSHQQLVLPDLGARIILHSAENIHARGYNARAAWLDEPIAFPSGGEALYRNLRRALRAPGDTPARMLITTTPPFTLDHWLLEVCAESTTRVTRGRARDNPYIDQRNVASWYGRKSTIESRRENDGEFVFGVDGALFRLEDIDGARVDSAPTLQQVVVACDPSQSAKKDADLTGLVCVGYAAGHLYVLESCAERLEPMAWAQRAITWAQRHHAGRFVVESTGSGSYPMATLQAQIRIGGHGQRPIVESFARGSKADRASPLSAAAAQGRLHLVGAGGHEALIKDLTAWYPGANWSPGALDALVHAASVLTHNWQYL